MSFFKQGVVLALLAVMGNLSRSVPMAPTEKPAVRVPTILGEYELRFREVGKDRWKDRAAQCWQESGFDPDVVYGRRNSSAGAQGIAQFMGATWRRSVVARGWVPPTATPLDPHWAILANHLLMNELESWAATVLGPRPFIEHYEVALAAYNAGPGSIKKAVFLARQAGLNEPGSWKTTLPRVTGKHSNETLGYLPRIMAFRKRLDLYDQS